jgi:hypothetical protein
MGLGKLIQRKTIVVGWCFNRYHTGYLLRNRLWLYFSSYSGGFYLVFIIVIIVLPERRLKLKGF